MASTVPKSSKSKTAQDRVSKRHPKLQTRVYKKKLALLLPAHNEELLIQATIKSAIAAGQNIQDIYVVNDASTDQTRRLATEMLGKDHVLNVKRSGKAIAIQKAIKKFGIIKRYDWLHVADADSIFGKNYFKIYRRSISKGDYVVAVGFVQSLRGNWISHYRAFTYTYSQLVIRRAQSWFNMISVFPGPITAFKTSIIEDLEYDVDSLTEDFDITLQVYRKSLGRVKFIPEAVNYTQDPQTLKDFCKQSMRWQRGFFQGVVKYRIGTKGQTIDFSIGFQLLELALFFIQMLVIAPYFIATTGDWLIVPFFLILDFFVVSLLAFFSCLAAGRLNILAALPYYYFLRWVELGIFLTAFTEVVVLRKFREKVSKGWQTEGRRYALSDLALKDTA